MIKKKFAGKVLALMVLLCVLLTGSVLTAWAEEPLTAEPDNGMIRVNLPTFASGTTLKLAEVGGIDNGTITLNDRFAPSGVVISGLTEASQAQEAAEQLTAYAAEHEIADAWESFYDSGDKPPVYFTGLKADNTLYLIYQEPNTNQKDIIISPMLVLLPYVNAEGETLTEVELDAKYERPLPDTGAVILTKVDVRNHDITLQGAEFRLEVKKYDTLGLLKAGDEGVYEDEGGLYYWETVNENLVTNDTGKLAVEGLPFGLYRFVETKAPDGFLINNTVIEVVVDKGGLYKLDPETQEVVPDYGYVTSLMVENTPIIPPPDTPSQPSEPSEPSQPSEPSEPSQPKPSEPSETTQTGDNASKYIIVGVIVGVSLVVVILLIVLGKKGKKKDGDE